MKLTPLRSAKRLVAVAVAPPGPAGLAGGRGGDGHRLECGVGHPVERHRLDAAVGGLGVDILVAVPDILLSGMR